VHIWNDPVVHVMSLEWIGMMCYLKLWSLDLSLLAVLGNFIQ
jgi:hypothetical protein